MWVLFAFGSALFAGITAVLSKIGMQDMDSDVGTAVRTGVVLVFSWMMVFLTGSIGTVGEISGRTFLFPGWPPALPGCSISGRCSWEM